MTRRLPLSSHQFQGALFGELSRRAKYQATSCASLQLLLEGGVQHALRMLRIRAMRHRLGPQRGHGLYQRKGLSLRLIGGCTSHRFHQSSIHRELVQPKIRYFDEGTHRLWYADEGAPPYRLPRPRVTTVIRYVRFGVWERLITLDKIQTKPRATAVQEVLLTRGR